MNLNFFPVLGITDADINPIFAKAIIAVILLATGWILRILYTQLCATYRSKNAYPKIQNVFSDLQLKDAEVLIHLNVTGSTNHTLYAVLRHYTSDRQAYLAQIVTYDALKAKLGKLQNGYYIIRPATRNDPDMQIKWISSDEAEVKLKALQNPKKSP